MRDEETQRGMALFRARIEASGKLKVVREQGYPNRWATYFEIGLEAKRTDIVLSGEFLSDLPATKEYQSSVTEYAGWLQNRMQNLSPHDFHCKFGRPINAEIFWPMESIPGRTAYFWKVEAYDLRGPNLRANCAVVMTWEDLEAFKGKPFQLEQAIIEAVRHGVDENQLRFLSAEDHPSTFQQLRIEAPPSGAHASSDLVHQFIAEKVYWLGFKRGDQSTRVWVADPWDAMYLGTTIQALVQGAQTLRAKKFITLSSDNFATAGDLLLIHGQVLEGVPTADPPRRIGFV